jgi:biotin operon repressor
VGGEAVRRFLVENMADHPSDIVRLAASEFGCSRQAVHKHLQRLIAEGAVVESGQTRSKRYALAPMGQWDRQYDVVSSLAEDAVWRSDIAPLLGRLPENVLSIWQFGVTEMFNNVIDHLARTGCRSAVKTAAATTIDITTTGSDSRRSRQPWRRGRTARGPGTGEGQFD